MSASTIDRDVLRCSEGDPLAPAYHPEHSVDPRPEHEAPRHRTGSHRVAVRDGRHQSTLLARTATAAAWLLGALGGMAALLHVVFGAGAFVELSDSMSPQYRAGDLVLTRLKSPDALSVGDVIAVTPPGHTARVAHRIIAITGAPQAPVITTKGDANPVADDWHITARSDVSVAIADIQGGGRAVTLIHSDALRALLVLVIGLGFTALVVRRMLPAPDPASGSRPAVEQTSPKQARSTDQEIA